MGVGPSQLDRLFFDISDFDFVENFSVQALTKY